MRSRHAVVGLLTCGLAMAWASAGKAQTFKPFDDVTSVCPTCHDPSYDKVTLKSGQVVEAVVVAENPMFYVLARFGEMRAVGRDQVTKVERSSNAVRPPGHVDQLLCKDGFVLSGKVVKDNASSGYVEFASVGVKEHMLVLKSLVQAIFESGKAYYSAPATPPAEPKPKPKG